MGAVLSLDVKKGAEDVGEVDLSRSESSKDASDGHLLKRTVVFQSGQR